ncbi:SMI1/KNR4 family protein [Streptomyces sp. NPDC048196]|uniref:SMI1/KNR4 family protein n=1 Tax=Streptomyces sp. NPDC048196 TaxID=3154712 RepID=UPI0033EC61BD
MIDTHGPLARIIERVPPPAETIDGHGDWASAEELLGTALPHDYKQLVEIYGRGDFWGALCLCTPFGDDNPVRLAADLLDDYGPMRESWPEQYPYPLFPEQGGLLTWAVTDIGTRLCWLTAGLPASWSIVIWSRDDEYERFDCGAATFLESWLSGLLTSELLPHDPDLAPWFDAAIPRDHIYLRLGDGALPYAERLQILRAALAPTADRGSYEYDGNRQDHFVATETGWQLTYETAYGHQLRVAFPPADSARARHAVLTAVDRMGCAVQATQTIHGTSSWSPQSEG